MRFRFRQAVKFVPSGMTADIDGQPVDGPLLIDGPLETVPLHPRVAGEHSAYYFDPAELGVTTTSASDETW